MSDHRGRRNPLRWVGWLREPGGVWRSACTACTKDLCVRLLLARLLAEDWSEVSVAVLRYGVYPLEKVRA